MADIKDVIRVMVSTDNHLGYGEKDPIRGEDSFVAFEEMLQMAVTEDVDFILLGGDLFHDAVPSQNTLHRCMKLLRTYTFGDKPIALEFLSDQTLNFHNAASQKVNYEDPNLNVSIPVFSIHGNHDDPSGFGRLSSLDLLSTTGLVNYFGRWADLSQIEINPILLRKGQTQLALYGLSHIHDSRLARLFENSKVSIECPAAEEGVDWFHLMVLHQNRADRGPKNYLPEDILPDFLHLVIWGHEHDCRIEPEYNPKQDFYVSQPGSSVPTSLADGESLKKHVGVLEIYQTKFQMRPLPLETVRPFVFESVNLAEIAEELALDEGDASNKVRTMAEQRVLAMIERAKALLTGHPQQPTLPLIRLRLVFTQEDQMFNAIRFGQMFNEQVANPADMIHFKKSSKSIKQETVAFDKAALNSAFQKMEIDTGTRVEDLVNRYFDEVQETKKLQLMSSSVLSEMCYRLVERRDGNAADNIIQFYKEKAVEHLMETLPSADAIGEQLLSFRDKITHEEILKVLDERSLKATTAAAVASAAASAAATTTAAAATNSKKQMQQPIEVADNDDDDSFESVPSAATSTRGRKATSVKEIKTIKPSTPSKAAGGRGRGRGRGARGAAATSTRSGHVMPQLEVTVGSSTRSSPRQQTLLNAVGRTQRKKAPVYVVSSESD